MSTRKSKLEDRIAGALYGFAIGDAMGATTEFETAQTVKQKYGKVTDIVGGGWLNLKPGEVTDDTQMTICVIEAIMKYPDNLEAFKGECAYNFIKWMQGGPKDIGGQCAKGIRHLHDHGILCMAPDQNAQGNGSLMRALPCALINDPDYNAAQARMTHNSVVCNEMIKQYHERVQCYLSGDFKEYVHYEHMDPTGWVVATYNNACYWVQNAQTLSEAILGAVNDGGDADTIAAITGSLAGLRHGYKAIPEEWLTKLDENVKNIFEKFIKMCLQIV